MFILRINNTYGIIIILKLNNLISNKYELNLSPSANLIEAAKKFFDYLHRLDRNNYKGIAVAPIPNYGLGKTINDRLKRAILKK